MHFESDLLNPSPAELSAFLEKFPPDDFGKGRPVRTDNWGAARHGLERSQTEPLVQRREHERSGSAHEGGEFLLRHISGQPQVA